MSKSSIMHQQDQLHNAFISAPVPCQPQAHVPTTTTDSLSTTTATDTDTQSTAALIEIELSRRALGKRAQYFVDVSTDSLPRMLVALRSIRVAAASATDSSVVAAPSPPAPGAGYLESLRGHGRH